MDRFGFETTRGMLERYRGARVALVPNPGNAGDAAITYGAYCLLKRAGIAYRIGQPGSDVLQWCDVVLYGGGGNLVPFYGHALALITDMRRAGKDVVVLPHTISGCTAELAALGGQLHLICRDRTSFEELCREGFPADRVHLDHDLAFAMDRSGMPLEPAAARQGRAFCLRTDVEALDRGQLPPDNLDISLSWNGYLWHNAALSWSVTASLMSYLSRFTSVVTDRLHVAILGALIGCDVTMLPNAYYKNRAIFDHSLAPFFDNVRFEELRWS